MNSAGTNDHSHLSRVQRLDSIALDETFFTEEGYLVDHPIVTSVGVFEYRNPDGSIRRELRLPKHVFASDSLASYEGKPIIITHDAGRVNKRNVEDEIVGTMLSKGFRDADNVRTKIIIHAIDEVKSSGLRELSLGYDLVLDETPGEWNGQPYDAIQTEIRINHLALVSDARAGEQARLNIDGTTQTPKGEKSMRAKQNSRRRKRLDEGTPDEQKKEITTEPTSEDNEETAVTAEPATAEERLNLVKDRRDRRDQEGDPETPEVAKDIIARQDEDIDTLLEIIEELQAKSDFDNAAAPQSVEVETDDIETEPVAKGGTPTIVIKTDSVDAIVRERIKLGRIGDRLNLDGLEEMNPLEAKKAIIKKVNPGMRLDGKGRAYINAAFDVAVDQIKSAKDTNFQRRQASSRADAASYQPSGKTAADRARERMIENMTNGGNS